MAEVYDDTTEPLPNGAKLPEHPANTTARKIISYESVWDYDDGRPLKAGLHQNEISVLMNGQQMALGHLHYYAIVNNRIYHTRKLVTVDVKCVDSGL